VGYGLGMTPALRLLAVACAIVVAGCTAGAPRSVAPASTQSAPPTTQPPSMSPAASTGASASPTAAVVATIDDPSLTMTLPANWQRFPVATFRAEAEQQAATAPEPIKGLYADALADIDAGAMRLIASGPSGFDPWQATMLVEVTNVSSIEAQITEIKRRSATIGKPTTSEQTQMTLSIGVAERLTETADPPAGLTGLSTPARGLNYVVKLADGRILWINASGPAASSTFADMIDATVETIASGG
jgi:hypothetical protein